MKTVGLVLIGLVFLQLVIALTLSHGLDSKIFAEERDLGAAMRRLRTENPKASFVVRACYSLMIVELLGGILYRFAA